MPSSKTGGAAGFSGKDADELFRVYISSRDAAVRDRLVLMHQNLVRFLASKFANRGEALEDLVQVGMIGLINAIDRFDASRGTKFSTYATPTIVGEIRRHFRDKAWALRVPRRLQELNLAASKAADRLGQTLGRPATFTEIALEVGATEEDTLAAIEMGSAYETVSLDSKLSHDDDSAPLTLAEFVGSLDRALDDVETYGDLKRAVDNLETRERDIIRYRFFLELSQTEVARMLNISQMHVSRLQQKALRHLKELLSD